MAEDIALYRVFIATPGGLELERRQFAQTLDQYNVAEAVHRQAMFFPVGWEDTLAGVGRPQSLINQDLSKCDYFVLVLWDRWGTPPGGDAQHTSGTEEEFDLAMKHLKDTGHPRRQVVVLFKTISGERLRDPGEQLQKVLAFKKKLEADRILLFSTFDTLADFEEKLRRHLAEWLREHERTLTTREARERARSPEPTDTSQTFTAPGVLTEAGHGSVAPRTDSKTCTIIINTYSGTREPIPAGTRLLVTVINGHQKTIFRDFHESWRLILQVPYDDNFGDMYSVLVWADGYSQAGFHPVTVIPGVPVQIDLMLLRLNAGFHFERAQWEQLRQSDGQYADLLAAGANGEMAAKSRYEMLMETRPAVLGCFFNLATAMMQVNLAKGTVLSYIRELIWDDSSKYGMNQDRLFSWADSKLIDQIRLAGKKGLFASESGASIFHPGATSSWKQIHYGEVNLQLTFYEDQKSVVKGTECVLVEAEFDYYKDLGAHVITEVITNAVTQSLTDPRQVYAIRWIVGRRAGAPEFNPPYLVY
jgi:hypothetical protein